MSVAILYLAIRLIGLLVKVLKGEKIELRTTYSYRNVLKLIWSSKNGHPFKRLLPKKNYSQKHLGFYNPKMNGDGDCYKTFQYT